MSISSLSKRNVNVNFNADAVGKVGKNEIGFLWIFVWKGVKQRLAVGDNDNFFWSWVLLLTLLFISRGRFWARFGMVGMVGLGWIIVDLSRCKLKEEKKEYYLRGSGCDDKPFHFFLNTIPIYSV